MILDNHNSEIINQFSATGEASGLTTNYKNLLKLSKKNGCAQNYKPCGVLDTVGNALCIDQSFQCPINSMKVDFSSRESDYSSNGYISTPLASTSYNHKFYHSNNYIEGNSGVIIIKSEDEPKYITKSNFLVDYEIYKDLFGDLKLIESLSGVLGGDNGKNNDGDDDDDNKEAVKIVQLLLDESDEGEMELYKMGAKFLFVLITDDYNKKLEGFKKYIEKKLEEDDEENIDIYFNHIGDNFYVKNYIGFKKVEDINKFLKFDYSIYKKKFPNATASKFALADAIVIGSFVVVFIIFKIKYSSDVFFKSYLLYAQCIVFYGASLGFFIYCIVIYIQVNKNKTLEELKSIESDEFINSFIKDFVSKCQENALILSTMIISFITFISHLITIIIYKKGDDNSFGSRVIPFY